MQDARIKETFMGPLFTPLYFQLPQVLYRIADYSHGNALHILQAFVVGARPADVLCGDT